jgi:hypothetical protein
MARGTEALARESVSLGVRELNVIQDDPAALGFAPESSMSSRLRVLIEEGLLARRDRLRREARIASYQEWASEEEPRDVATAIAAETRAQGGFLAEYREQMRSANNPQQ